jgi:hypothetical protein
MMDHSTKPPETLMRAIAQDLTPVKPSPLPFRLVLRMTPPAVLISSLILLAIGMRHDSGKLGPLLTWGASALQFGLAILLVWIAARESTPANRLPKKIVYSAVITTFLVVVAVTLLTFFMSPAHRIPRVRPWAMDFACGIGSTIAGGILVVLFSWIYRNSLATRPMIAGGLYGAGAGVAINAGWRLACPATDPWHVLGAHGMAVIASALLGAVIGRFLGTRRVFTTEKRPRA